MTFIHGCNFHRYGNYVNKMLKEDKKEKKDKRNSGKMSFVYDTKK